MRTRLPRLLTVAEHQDSDVLDRGRDPRSAEDVVVDAQFEAVVVDALAALPTMHRVVVQLVDVDGLSYAEAAEALGIPRGTVMSRLHRARARIRTRLVAAGLVPHRSQPDRNHANAAQTIKNKRFSDVGFGATVAAASAWGPMTCASRGCGCAGRRRT